MRKVLSLFVAFLLLPHMVLAEAAEEVSLGAAYAGACPHELFNFGTVLDQFDDAWGSLEDGVEYTSGVCCYCNRVYHVILSGETGDPQRREPADCEHQFRRIPYVLEEGWYPSFTGAVSDATGNYELMSMFHEQRSYYLCVCIHCDTAIRMYDGGMIHGNIGEDHVFPPVEESSVHTHLHHENKHLYMLTCEVCGYNTALILPCVMYDNGMCDVMLRRALETQGCDSKNGVLHDWRECPRCR